MEALFASGRIIDIILGLVAVELVLLLITIRHRSADMKRGLVANIAAGASLMLALRLSIGGAWWGWIGACLACALVAHLVDLSGRLKA